MPSRLWSARTLLLALVLALVAAGCTTDPPEPVPTADDAIPEEALTAGEIERDWVADGEHLVSPRLATPHGATRVGVLLTLRSAAGERPPLEARGLDASGAPGPWVRLETTWAEADQAVARAELGFLAHAAELRVPARALPTLAGITWSALVPARLPAPSTLDVGRATLPLRDELADAGVVSRETWGARATTCTTTNAVKYRMAIHHTVTPATGDPAVRMRGIQAFHMDTRNFCDIGYHFLVSLDGRVWEGRPVQMLGAHVGGHNTGNIGISFIGCFHTSSCNDWTPFEPPDVMVDAAGDLVRVLAGLYDVVVDDETIIGHRDHPDQATACPGNHLHARLDRIRELGSMPPLPTLAAELVAQSFPGEPLTLRAGEEVSGHFELRNIGTATWEPGTTFLGTTEPRDGVSPLAGPDWIAPSRAATVDATVPPGSTGRFALSVRAPAAPGTYGQFFNLVQDGVGWFSDPDQGGPPDDRLELRVTVLDATGDGGPPGDAGSLGDAGLDAGDGPERPPAVDGCGCRAVGARRAPVLAGLFASLCLVLVARRRR